MKHLPVMVAEVIAALEPGRGTVFVDATIGPGGHAAALMAAAGPAARLVGIDRNPATLATAAANLSPFADRVTLATGDFRNLGEIPGLEATRGGVDGILYDLGLSRLLIEESGAGFSFRRDEPLDMRFNPAEGGPSAADLLQALPPEDLAGIFYRYGEIRNSRALAARIAAVRGTRPIRTSGELADIARRVIRRRGPGDPATRVFQALRIAVNDELGALEETLPRALRLLRPGGRLVVISYHSLEDRIVKYFFRDNPGLEIMTRKPTRPGQAEIKANRAARSAKLRAAVKRTGEEPAPPGRSGSPAGRNASSSGGSIRT